MRVWDVETGKEALRTLEFPTGLVAAIAPSPDGKVLAAVGSGRVLIWDVTTGKELRRVERMKHA